MTRPRGVTFVSRYSLTHVSDSILLRDLHSLLARERAATAELLAHLAEVYAAYDEASPLADGWQERLSLHALSPLMFHALLFGGGYGAQALSVARSYA